MKTLYICMTEYLKEHGFTGHIKNVKYWYRKVYNLNGGKSATQRLDGYKHLNKTMQESKESS